MNVQIKKENIAIKAWKGAGESIPRVGKNISKEMASWDGDKDCCDDTAHKD